MTRKEVARELNISLATVDRYRRKGHLTGYTNSVTNRVWFDSRDVARLHTLTRA